MPRPYSIGTFWTTKDFNIIHGPRFRSPQKFKESGIFVRGKDKSFPRSVVGILHDGRFAQQSFLRNIYPEEKKFLKSISVERLDEMTFPRLVVNPYRKFDGKLYMFYTFAFNKKRLEKFTEHIEKRYTYRTIKRSLSGKKIYLIYRRMKRPVAYKGKRYWVI
jgi:hypothetical protein